MDIYNIMYSMKHLDAKEWFFSDDRGPVRKKYCFSYLLNQYLQVKEQRTYSEPLADD